MSSENGSIRLATLMTLPYLALKLTGAIDWSWWWVFWPLWLVVGVIVGNWAILNAAAWAAAKIDGDSK